MKPSAELDKSRYINAFDSRQASKFLTEVIRRAKQLEKRQQYSECLDYYERQLFYCVDVYGKASDQAMYLCENFASNCNAFAILAVQQGSAVQPTQLLRRAISTLKAHGVASDPRRKLILAISYNNLGTHYRRLGRLRASLGCFKKALKYEEKLEEVEHHADTHINMCATLSALGQHGDAASHIAKAVKLLKNELDAYHNGESGHTAEHAAQRAGVMAVAMHNHAVELEHLDLHHAALRAYAQAAETAELFFGPSHPTTRALRQALEGCDADGCADEVSTDMRKQARPSSARSVGGNSVVSFGGSSFEQIDLEDLDEDLGELSDDDELLSAHNSHHHHHERLPPSRRPQSAKSLASVPEGGRTQRDGIDFDEDVDVFEDDGASIDEEAVSTRVQEIDDELIDVMAILHQKPGSSPMSNSESMERAGAGSPRQAGSLSLSMRSDVSTGGQD